MKSGLLSVSLSLLALVIACADDGAQLKSCAPGAQVECDCPGGLVGAQVCGADGKSYSECTNCGAGVGGSGGFPSGGTAGTTPTGGSGGQATGGAGGGAVYAASDCLATANNDAEVCDDNVADVPSPPTGLVLVCLNANGGTTYVSSNTGPVMSDGVPRCQGWEQNGQNAWDHLQYLVQLPCDAAQKTLDVDLTSSVGSPIYVGSHDNPAGGGDSTPACLAFKK